MHAFLTGSSGLIGKTLQPLLRESGYQITRLVRRPAEKEDERSWDPGVERLSTRTLEGCDVLIHLAGENIAVGRWTEKQKQKIRESRVHSTRILAEAIAGMAQPPKAFIVASATGYYGDRGDEILDEDSPPGEGFLADVCLAWEQAADPCRERTRVCHVRTGIVLSPDGGALGTMLTPFKLGVGGKVGSGNQYMSWVSIRDAARIFQFAANTDSLVGPVNNVAPHPVTNREFTKTLGKVLFRPTLFPLPGVAAKAVLGEMAEELLLASTRVLPTKATEHGFQFEHPELETALRSLSLR